MMILVIGGSGSGKSSYAEDLACTLSKTDNTPRYYLATMQISDDEGLRKVKRHKALRYGKEFLTIEQPVHIENALLKMENGKKTVLLECISNLVANEMFAQASQPIAKEIVTRNVIKGMEQLKKETSHLIVVSNNVFEDGMTYDQSTMDYIYAMGEINQALAAFADRVVEIVLGIPVYLKQ